MWYAKPTGGYTSSSTEGRTNATNIASYLEAQGWSLTSICALLGNGAGESGLNPWRWESDYIPTVNEFSNWTQQQEMQHGYGIFGFTPARKYINSTNQSQLYSYGYAPNFSDLQGNATDGLAQLIYFMSTVAANWTHNLYNYYEPEFTAIGVDISTFYNVSYSDFIHGVNGNTPMTLAECVGAFELCYEKPAASAAASSYNNRVAAAQAWYNYFSQTPVPPYVVSSSHRLPIWMYGI